MSAKSQLLFALAAGPGFHGSELIARASAAGKLHAGSVYPALRSLEQEGYIDQVPGEQRPAGSGGRARKHYRITTKGLLQVEEWRLAIAILTVNGPES